MKGDLPVELVEVFVNPAKNDVGFPVTTSAIAPGIDNALVVAE